MDLTISVIQNTSAFHDLKESWNNLLKNSQSNTIFLRWEWLYNWWRVYENPKRFLYIVLVKEHGRVLGIAPLCIEKKFTGIVKEIKFLGSNKVCSDYLDFILLKGREEETLTSILSFLQDQKHLWNRFNLTDIPEDSSTISIIQSYFGEKTAPVNTRYTICPYINLNEQWDTIVDSFASVVKNTISRKLKKFSALPDSDFYKADPDDIQNFYLKFVRLNKKRMKMMKRNSPFNDPDFLKFHKIILQELSGQGIANLYFLKAEDTFFAGIYILSYNGKYHFYQSGFFPDWSWLSPGTLLFYFCIKDAYKNHAAEFDFLRGDEKYKDSWTKMQQKNKSILIYNARISSAFFQILEYNWTRLRGNIKKLAYDAGK